MSAIKHAASHSRRPQAGPRRPLFATFDAVLRLVEMLSLNVPLLLLALAFCSGLRAIAQTETSRSVPVRGTVALNQPVAVYNNWAAYDELSDNIEITENLA